MTELQYIKHLRCLLQVNLLWEPIFESNYLNVKIKSGWCLVCIADCYTAENKVMRSSLNQIQLKYARDNNDADI